MSPQEKQFENFKQKKINDMENQEQTFSPDELVQLARENPGATAQMHHVANGLLYLSAGIFNNAELIRLLDQRIVELTQKHIREVQALTDRIDILEARLMGLSDPHEAGLN
jgi:hypothetical protein